MVTTKPISIKVFITFIITITITILIDTIPDNGFGITRINARI